MVERVGRRLMLRKFSLAPSTEFRYRASIFAGRYWCDEQMRIRCLDRIVDTDRLKKPEHKAAAEAGTAMHEELFNTGRRYPWEETFIEAISKYLVDEMGFVRKYSGVQIYDNITGHPDDFQITPGKRVTIVEYKTVAGDNKWWRKYVMATAKVQAATLYPWILEPTAFRLGYEMDDTHAVIFYDRETKKILEHKSFRYSESNSEQFLAECFEIIHGERETYQPAKHKCYMCPDDIIRKCRFYKAGLLKLSKKQIARMAKTETK